MLKTYMASQKDPYELINKKVRLPRESARLRNLVSIVLLTHPDYNEKDIEEMFCSLNKRGCTYATYANAIIFQLSKDKELSSFLEEFQNLFGYSLYDSEKNVIDFNRLLVDLYSTLYKIGNLTVFWDCRYSYKSQKDAAIDLGLIKENETYDEIAISNMLYNNGYLADGLDEKGNFVFKDIKNPVKVENIGTYQELAQRFAQELSQKVTQGLVKKVPQELAQSFFYKDFSNFSNDEIKEIFKNNNIQVGKDSYEDHTKLSGLTTKNINCLLNEFFRRRKIDLEVNVQNFAWGVSSPEDLLQKVNENLESGASISVSSEYNHTIYMKNLKEKFFNWVTLENGKVGHAMFLKGISDERDLIVSSWGNDYLVPIDFCEGLVLNSIIVKRKYNYDLGDQEKSNMAK